MAFKGAKRLIADPAFPGAGILSIAVAGLLADHFGWAFPDMAHIGAAMFGMSIYAMIAHRPQPTQTTPA